MTKSESIGKLAEALSKAQGVMRGAVKDSENPFFKSKYSDLASVWDACREALSANGLAVSQLAETTDNKVTVHTILMHCSGEWIASELSMTPVKSDPQGMGSTITYARRYALSAAVGIAPEDDDGNAGSLTTQRAAKDAKIEPPRPAKTESRSPVVQTAQQAVKGALEKISEKPNGAPSSAPTREPGSDDEDITFEHDPSLEPIDLPRQRALHREFRDAIKNDDARKAADSWLRIWLEKRGYIGNDGKGTTKTIPMYLFDSVKREAVAYAASLPA